MMALSPIWLEFILDVVAVDDGIAMLSCDIIIDVEDISVIFLSEESKLSFEPILHFLRIMKLDWGGTMRTELRGLEMLNAALPNS